MRWRIFLMFYDEHRNDIRQCDRWDYFSQTTIKWISSIETQLKLIKSTENNNTVAGFADKF